MFSCLLLLICQVPQRKQLQRCAEFYAEIADHAQADLNYVRVLSEEVARRQKKEEKNRRWEKAQRDQMKQVKHARRTEEDERFLKEH